MRKSVAELIEMYENGKIHLSHSTQREFIYNNIYTINSDGKITKAGDVIKSILEEDIQLPALYFWNVQDDEHNIHYANDEYNVHDGKQRFSSILYFIYPTDTIAVTTVISGKEKTFKTLSRKMQEKLLNYQIDIVERVGTEAQEEKSFIKINSSAENLTSYESIRGALHGKFIEGFEKFIDDMSSTYDVIDSVGRGKQAIYFLQLCFGISDEENEGIRLLKTREHLRTNRERQFNEADFHLKEKLKMFSELRPLVVSDKSSSTADGKGGALGVCQLVQYIFEHKYNFKTIKSYYERCRKVNNDIPKWKFDIHKIAIDALCIEHIECDGKRFFTDNDKSDLYEKSAKCSVAGCTETSYNKLEVDHIKPWSKGGRTNLSNAQLLCKKHNSSKNNK